MTSSINKTNYLKKYFGYDQFRPNQEAIIDDLLAGKDVVAIMPTGGGKSLCFQLPALILQGTAIVVSPLIALMKDQVDALHANGIAADYYNSSQSSAIQNQVLQNLHQQKTKLLYVAPESLGHLLPNLQEENISLFAIDEAHCISAWGHDFRPAYTQLGKLKVQFPSIPVAAFTATADVATQDDIVQQLQIPSGKKHLASFDRKNLFLEVRPGTQRLPQILKFLKNKKEESGIIYCLSRKNTKNIAQKLNEKGLEAQAYHAGLSPEKRSQIQDDFVNDRTPIIVATIAFGMGIDKSNVRWVIHYNMPKNIEGYYQEVGRSGRDGLPAETLLFYSYADVIQLRQFMEDAPNAEFQLAKLERMQQFAEALSCRRIALLNYFGEHVSKNCGNCDNCQTPPEFFDGTILAQKICSAVHRLKQQEPIGMLVDVLRGSKNAQIYDKGYQHIKTYGVAKNVAWLDLQQYVIQLVNQGILEIRFHQNGRLLLTPLAKKVLFEGEKVQLASLQIKKKSVAKEALDVPDSSRLFEALRTLRKEIAIDEKVPAYVVFSDAALKDMEKLLPKTEEEFLEVSGVGEAKNEKYGKRFLKAIANFLEAKKKVKKTTKKSKTPTHKISYQLFKDGKSIAEIAKERSLTENTIYGHLMKMHESEGNIDLHSFISQYEIKTIVKAKNEAEQENEEIGLKTIFEELNEEVPYWKIKMALYLDEV
ncbi:DNA helicase RecQ [Psychroflexus salis]|uniref:DNA helicase RecQ n=1 Tax=Psychroflexus salis TaxID=1526574 RepID=A0A917E9R1_9FLAO|nr:DNA helicase RecQ [Psychroflexus salis]GGE13043.1 ATP-dependent DNA helicase RecQ [Psychroflexus salis]